MKIYAVNGSPNKNGNTNTLLERYIEGVLSKHTDAEVKKIDLIDLNINYCVGCMRCNSDKNTSCISKDDMESIYSELTTSDVIVLTSPIYWFDMTAQLKTFIDRLSPLLGGSSMKGKKLVFLSTYAGFDHVSSGAENAYKIMKSTSEIFGMDYSYFGVSTEMMKKPVSVNSKAHVDIVDFAKRL